MQHAEETIESFRARVLMATGGSLADIPRGDAEDVLAETRGRK